MKEVTKYLKLEQKKDIINLYERGLSISTISLTVEEPQAVIQTFLLEQGYSIIPKKYAYEVHGHIQFTDFNSIYEHQWILSKYLKVELEDIRKYIVHHVNQNKKDNNEGNLWVFFDSGHHRQYHSLLSAGDIGDSIEELYDFCLRQVDKDLKDLEDLEEQGLLFKGIAESLEDIKKIRQEYAIYVKIINKLLKKHKKNTFINQSPQQV